MIRNVRSAAALLLAALLVLPMAGHASAAGSVDLNRRGSVTINLKTASGTSAQNAQISLYRVGGAALAEGTLTFTPDASLGAGGMELNGMSAEQNQANAASLWAIVRGLEGEPAALSGTTDANGAVVFGDLEAGVYLAVQTRGASGLHDFTPFLITLPLANADGTGWGYVLSANPKIEEAGPGPEPDPNPRPDSKPSAPPADPPPDDGVDIGDNDVPGGGLTPDDPEITIEDPDVPLNNLPQTGMLQWPVPVLALAGLLLFSAGWYYDRSSRAGRDS